MTNASNHADTPQPANDAAPTQADAMAFVLAPLAPLSAITTTMGQAWAEAAMSQARFSMAMARTATDAWILAMRRQQDAMFGLASAPSETPNITDDAVALNEAAEAARSAGLELFQAQARAIERLRQSA